MFERLAPSPKKKKNLETEIRGRDEGRRREEPANKEERRQTGETNREERVVNTQGKKNKRPRTRDTQTISSSEFPVRLAR